MQESEEDRRKRILEVREMQWEAEKAEFQRINQQAIEEYEKVNSEREKDRQERWLAEANAPGYVDSRNREALKEQEKWENISKRIDELACGTYYYEKEEELYILKFSFNNEEIIAFFEEEKPAKKCLEKIKDIAAWEREAKQYAVDKLYDTAKEWAEDWEDEKDFTKDKFYDRLVLVGIFLNNCMESGDNNRFDDCDIYELEFSDSKHDGVLVEHGVIVGGTFSGGLNEARMGY